MDKRLLNIVVCGDVDHGKSTLLGRLLLETGSLSLEKISELEDVCHQRGKDLEPAFFIDQLKEEREQERTIDTAQVFLKTRKRSYCLIDTPGHVEFIKNMMTGLTQAEAALLLVDASCGVQEQTQRHVSLLKMCGVSSMIVAVNKMDLVSYGENRFREVCRILLSVLDGARRAAVAVIPVVAKKGDNILKRSERLKWYKGPVLIEAMDALESYGQAERKPLRFSIQDVYRIDGEVVYAGRVESGCIRARQKVIILPDGEEAEISAVKVYGAKKGAAYAGENIGLTLKGSKSRRGEILSSRENQPFVVKSFEGSVFWISLRPLKLGQTVSLRCAAQEVRVTVDHILQIRNSATLEVLEREEREVKCNELAKVVFRSDVPWVIENFNFTAPLGRFVLEDAAGVCGFGMKIG